MDDLIKNMESDCYCSLYERDGDEGICPVCEGINEIRILRKEIAYWKSVAERLMKVHG